MDGLSDFSKFSELLCAELSKIEHEYSEVLYRMKYIDEQLISIGKKDSLQKIMHDLYKNINFTKQEKIFIARAYKENLDILIHALALCENPIEIMYKVLENVGAFFISKDGWIYFFSMNKKFYLCKRSVYYQKDDMYKYFIQLKDHDIQVYKAAFEEGTNDIQVCAVNSSKSTFDCFYFEIKGVLPTKKIINEVIDSNNPSYYGVDILAIDLYEKVLNKRIELENLKSQYNRKMKLFYS